MELTIALETVCRLIVRAREYEAQVPALDDDSDEDPTESDDPFAPLEDEANTGVEEEIQSLLEDLADDELVEVLALALVGRGAYDAAEWADAIEEAGDNSTEAIIEQLFEMPMLAAYLDAGLAAFELSCNGIGQID